MYLSQDLFSKITLQLNPNDQNIFVQILSLRMVYNQRVLSPCQPGDLLFSEMSRETKHSITSFLILMLFSWIQYC